MRSLTVWALAGAVLALSAGASAAQGRPDARTMTCGQARALVQQSGAVVLTTGRYTYDRYVASERHCAFAETIERAWIATRDTPSCFVGYVCVPERPLEDRWWWMRRH